MLSRPDLVRAVEGGGEQRPIAEVMRTDCQPVEESEMLEDTFQRMRQNGCSTVPVLRRGVLVGIITLENVGEWMMVQSALRRARARHEIDDIYHANG
jgi:predicted transcriptional regulator